MTIDERIDELLSPIFAYGVDWTEYREKQLTGDNDVAVYAGKIKAEHKENLAQAIKQLITEARISTLKGVVGKPQTDSDWSDAFEAGHKHGVQWMNSRIKFEIQRNKKIATLRGELK